MFVCEQWWHRCSADDDRFVMEGFLFQLSTVLWEFNFYGCFEGWEILTDVWFRTKIISCLKVFDWGVCVWLFDHGDCPLTKRTHSDQNWMLILDVTISLHSPYVMNVRGFNTAASRYEQLDRVSILQVTVFACRPAANAVFCCALTSCLFV